MAYTKTVWETGDVITATKLNNAEDGIEAASPLVISTTNEWVVESTTATLSYDILATDVISAFAVGKNIVLKINSSGDVPPYIADDQYFIIDGYYVVLDANVFTSNSLNAAYNNSAEIQTLEHGKIAVVLTSSD